MKEVHLVEDCENAPGRVLAVFADKADAVWFCNQLDEAAEVVTRTVWYGQPSNRGYNE